MAKFGRSLTDLAAEIERRAEAKRDYIAPVSKMSVEVVSDKPVIALAAADSIETFGIGDIAHGQLAEYAGIPLPYYRRLQEKDPQLLAVNVNRWLRDLGQQKRMLRTLDGDARALLSNSYRPLDNDQLAEAVLPVLLEDKNLLILSCEITERRLYIKAVDRSIEKDVPTGKHMGDGGHTIFDTCSPAITISNSEVGYGTLSIETGVYTRACTNLAMFGASMRKYHAGKKMELSEEVMHLLTDDTRRATDKAVWMQVRDLTRAAFDEAKFEALTKRLGQASQDRIEADGIVEVVERVGKRLNLLEGERKGILARLIEGGDLSRYGLHGAITNFSQSDAITYDRATELERLGGEVIELPTLDWQRIIAPVAA